MAVFFAFIFFSLSACTHTPPPPGSDPFKKYHTLVIGKLINHAYLITRTDMRYNSQDTAIQGYITQLAADRKITIGLGVGTEDLGTVFIPDNDNEKRSHAEYILWGKKVIIEGRLITTRDEFRKALSECEILFITSHSRFGAGPVFLDEGKAKPFRMQKTAGCSIVMPRTEVSGYQGKTEKFFNNPATGKEYTVFAPDSTDLDASRPLQGYQIIIMSTCTSMKHFLDDIIDFRKQFHTTAIFTTQACCMDTGMEVFVRLLVEIFQNNDITGLVAGINEAYEDISLRKVRMKIKPWAVIENLYAIGINNLP